MSGKDKEKKQVADWESTPGSPLAFLPGPFWSETLPQSLGGFSLLICVCLLYPYQPSAPHSMGRVCHLIFPRATAGRAWPSHCTRWERDSTGQEDTSIAPLRSGESKRHRVTKLGWEQIYFPQSGQLLSLWNAAAIKKDHILHGWDISTK